MDKEITIVNSYKGGTGKTSLSLSYCIREEVQKKSKNVVFMDLDFLGTGSEILLYGEKKFDGKYLNQYKGKQSKITDYIKPYLFKYQENEYNIFISLSDPVGDYKATYMGTNYLRNADRISKDRMIEHFLEIIQQIMNQNVDTHLILDCSPGVSAFENELIQRLYDAEYNYKVNEVYVVSFDEAHIRKTIKCLEQSLTEMKRKATERNILIVINDIHNLDTFRNFASDRTGEGSFNFFLSEKEVADTIKRELDTDGKLNLKVFYHKYDIKLSAGNLIGNGIIVENNVDAYNMIATLQQLI